MIEQILPSEVASADMFGDMGNAELFPREEVIVGRALDSRRQEFATARTCARRGLAKLGVPAIEIPPVGAPPLAEGAPLWPQGVVGSITHCDGYRGAAVAWSRNVVAVGIDAEPNEPLPPGALRRIALAREEAQLVDLARINPAISWGRLLFSAKESTYKAWFPLTHAWLGFEDAEVTIDPTQGTFESRLLVRGPTISGDELRTFLGRWIAYRGLVATAIAHPVRSSAAA